MFLATGDVQQQRQALLELLQAVGTTSDLAAADVDLSAVGYPGVSPWGAANVSYCWWWGVSCCGTSLTAGLQICAHGNSSVSALHLPAVGLNGTLPDLFGRLPDLQALDVSYNRGEGQGLGL